MTLNFMKKQRRFNTGILYSTSTFISGAATVINLAGNFYNYNASLTGVEADYQALANDFSMIGQDFNDVIENKVEGNDHLIKLDF
jgi:hypothetical protein